MIDSKQIISDLQEMRDQGFLSDALLRAAVRAIKGSDDRFEWVGAYLLNEDGDELWLHNYLGSPTEHAKIPVGTGVCGTAVAKGENQNVPDVSAVENYLSCNEDVQSEMVVLIRAGEEIFGQLDLDSEEKATFTDEHQAALEAIADKLAEQFMAERR